MANETEEQQIAALKKWWSDNATSIIFGVVLGLAGVFGGRAWINYQAGLSENAATIYTVMLQGLDAGDRQRVSQRAETLMTQYGSTPYAVLAALSLAKIHTEEGDLDAARSQLQWVLENGDIEIVNDIARLRLARVLVAQHSLDEADMLLQQPRSATAFDALYAEVTGDVFSARDDFSGASESYQRALAATPASNPGYALLELKYENARVNSKPMNEVSE